MPRADTGRRGWVGTALLSVDQMEPQELQQSALGSYPHSPEDTPSVTALIFKAGGGGNEAMGV